MPPAKKKNQTEDDQGSTPKVQTAPKKKEPVIVPPTPPKDPAKTTTTTTTLGGATDPLKKVLGSGASGLLQDLFDTSKVVVNAGSGGGDGMESLGSGGEEEEDDGEDPVPIEDNKPALPKVKLLKLVPATKIMEQYSRVLTGPVNQLFNQVKDDEDASAALLDAMVSLQIVPEGETKGRQSELQQLREQLAVANRNNNVLRSQVESGKQHLREVTLGAVKCFNFAKADGTVGKITQGSIDKISASNDRLDRVSVLLAGSKDNHAFSEALRGYVKGLS